MNRYGPNYNNLVQLQEAFWCFEHVIYKSTRLSTVIHV